MSSSQHEGRNLQKKLTPMRRRLIGTALLKAGQKNNEPSLVEVGKDLLDGLDRDSQRLAQKKVFQKEQFGKKRLPASSEEAVTKTTLKYTGVQALKILRWLLILVTVIAIFGAVVAASAPKIDEVGNAVIVYGIGSFFVLIYLVMVKPPGESWLSLEIEARKAKLRKRIRDTDIE